MFQRQSPYFESPVFVYHLVLARVDAVESDFVRHSLAEIFEPWFEQFLKVFVCVNGDASRTFEHSPGGEQSYKTEAMVAMEVTQKYVVQSWDSHSHLRHTDLSALSAVDKKLFVAQLKHLSAWRQVFGRFCRSCA